MIDPVAYVKSPQLISDGGSIILRVPQGKSVQVVEFDAFGRDLGQPQALVTQPELDALRNELLAAIASQIDAAITGQSRPSPLVDLQTMNTAINSLSGTVTDSLVNKLGQ